MPRITIAIPEEERAALVEMARAELRLPRDQVRVVLRAELARRGLLERTGVQGRTPDPVVSRVEESAPCR